MELELLLCRRVICVCMGVGDGRLPSHVFSDILSLRPATDLVNSIGIETELFLNNAVLAFDAGHPYLSETISRFVSGFKQVWGQQGPRLVTR
jgi:hypothetical protein